MWVEWHDVYKATDQNLVFSQWPVASEYPCVWYYWHIHTFPFFPSRAITHIYTRSTCIHTHTHTLAHKAGSLSDNSSSEVIIWNCRHHCPGISPHGSFTLISPVWLSSPACHQPLWILTTHLTYILRAISLQIAHVPPQSTRLFWC